MHSPKDWKRSVILGWSQQVVCVSWLQRNEVIRVSGNAHTHFQRTKKSQIYSGFLCLSGKKSLSSLKCIIYATQLPDLLNHKVKETTAPPHISQYLLLILSVKGKTDHSSHTKSICVFIEGVCSTLVLKEQRFNRQHHLTQCLTLLFQFTTVSGMQPKGSKCVLYQVYWNIQFHSTSHILLVFLNMNCWNDCTFLSHKVFTFEWDFLEN